MKSKEEILAAKMAHYNREDRPTPLPYPEMYKVRFSDDEKAFIHDCMREYAAQFEPKWVPVEEFNGEPGEMVLVKGRLDTDLGASDSEQIGYVFWKSKKRSECADTCYYSMWYTNITEVFVVPKTV